MIMYPDRGSGFSSFGKGSDNGWGDKRRSVPSQSVHVKVGVGFWIRFTVNIRVGRPLSSAHVELSDLSLGII